MVRAACLVGYGPWGCTELNTTKGITHTQGLTGSVTAPYRRVVDMGVRESISDC